MVAAPLPSSAARPIYSSGCGYTIKSWWMRMRSRAALLLLALFACSGTRDALPAWNDGPTKTALVRFVERVTRVGGPEFVPIEQRIAVFDNDGTLWVEQPAYAQMAFALDRVKQLAPSHPEWKARQPFAGILAGDPRALAANGEQGIAALLAQTHANMTTDEFEQIVTTWIAVARHPTLHRRYTELAYAPMLELLAYLRANGFTTYVVSGGGVEFMRPWTDRVYGIPRNQIIGSRAKLAYEVRNGVPTLERLPAVDLVDDKAGKPVGIQQAIGRRPILAVGNSDGDFEMLDWVTSAPGPRLGVIVHHTDGQREFAYDRKSHVGNLARALDSAPAHGWIVVDMKRDWSRVFE
jgi:hypothetical protein